MVTWRSPLRVPFDGAWLEESPLAWMASEASKPGRHSGLRWVLHASPEWSQSHLEDTPEEVRQALLEALGHALQAPLPETEAVSVHRWRYARVQKPLDRACLWDPEVGIGACGDWCLGERLEAALLSGQAAATGVLKSLESGVNAAD
jgi:hypothetical protein